MKAGTIKTSNTEANKNEMSLAAEPEGVKHEAVKHDAVKHDVAKPEAVKPEPVIRLLKTGSCPSLSGKSHLTYHVGCNDHQELFFCVVANSGGGMFSQEWVSLAAIQRALGKASSEKELTSFLLYPLFTGKSQNSPGFLFAALQGEGLVTASTTKRRCYELTDWAPFHAAMQAWAASGAGPKVEPNAAKGKGKSVKAPGDVTPTTPTKDVPAKKVEVMPLQVRADIVPTVEPQKPKTTSGKPPKKKAK